MTKESPTTIRKLNDSDLKVQIEEKRKELFDLRFKQATRQLTTTHEFKKVRLQLAQLLTVLNERNSSSGNTTST